MRNLRSAGDAELNGDVGPPSDLRVALAQARIFLAAGAWQCAHELLEKEVSGGDRDTVQPPDHYEALGLLLFACSRLGHAEHVACGTAELQKALALDVELSEEARALAIIHSVRRMANRDGHLRAIAAAESLREPWMQRVSKWTRARAELVLARVTARLGDLTGAEKSALQAVLLAEESRSDSLLADALVAVANIRSRRGDLDGVQRLLACAVERYWRVGDGLGRTMALVNRGVALLLKGDVAGSATIFMEAESSALVLGRQESRLHARLGLGWLAARGGRTDRARSLLLPCWRAARRAGLKREEALALEYLAEAYLWDSAPARWVTKTRVALGQCRRLADAIDPEGDVSIECHIKEAMLAHAEGQARSSERLALYAVDLAGRRQLLWEQAEAWRVVGLARLADGRTASSCRAFEESHALLLKMGEHFARWYVEAWLGVLCCEGAPSRSQDAVEDELGQQSRGSCTWSGVAEIPRTEELRHWLWHPVVGPLAWRSVQSGQPGSSQDRSARPVESFESAFDPTHHPSPTWSHLGLITRSPALRDTLLLAETYAAETIPILILGETGTGKDLLARGLHDLSGRSGQLVPVNCAAAQRHLFAAELFGARRGAYTGAVDHRRGLIHEAAGGTLFFDEIADLDPEAQGYLLRFLDSGEVRPLGDTRGERVETRVLAATRRDLHALVAAGSFREDLYMRLAAVILILPPLRDRLVDLPLLIEALWLRAGGAPEDRETVFTPEVLRELRQRPWPGNVRELSHIVSQSIPLLRARGAAAARARIQNGAGLGWHDGSHGQGHVRPNLANPGDAVSAAVRLGPGGGTGRDPALAPTDVTPPGRTSAISPSPHRILAKDPEGNWPESLLRNALDVAKGHVPTAARILGISRSQAYRLYKQLRGSRG